MRAALMIAALVLTGCATAGPTPEGFAPYRGRETRAVSPEGVVYQAREVKNDPEADVDFWAEALIRRQKSAGYRLVAQEEFDAGGLKGALIELEAPHGSDDYTYLIALIVDGSKIHVIEAAGQVSQMGPHREAIIEAVKKTPAG